MPNPPSTPLPTPSPPPARTRWPEWLAAALLVIAAVRGLAMLLHDPMVALANNYDQVRYTACYDLFPWRPGVDPARNHPSAPLKRYAFQPGAGTMCYWTSDLAFQLATAAIWRADEAAGGAPVHSVRVLGGLRLGAWFAAALLLSAAFRREGRPDAMVANAGVLALLLTDPVNAIYWNTFYAEGGTLFFAYLAVACATLCAIRCTRVRALLVVVAAAALGLGKLQHLALPLLMAAAVAVAWRAGARRRIIVGTLALGGLVSLPLQLAQLNRPDALMLSIAQANKTNLVLNALLPASRDPARTAQRLGLDRDCARHSGKSIFVLGVEPDVACPGIAAFGRRRLLALATSEPDTLARALWRVPARLVPWTPRYLGVVEDASLAPVPDDLPTIDRIIGERAPIAWALLLAPVAGLVVLLVRRRADPATVVFSACCVAIAVGVPVTTVFGDGYADAAKQSHLALNAGAAWSIAFACAALVRRRHTAVT